MQWLAGSPGCHEMKLTHEGAAARVRYSARPVFQFFEFSFDRWRRNHPDASPAPQREPAHRVRRFSGLGPSQVSGHRLERRSLAAAPPEQAPASKVNDRLSPIVERGQRSLKAAAPDWGAAGAHNRVEHWTRTSSAQVGREADSADRCGCASPGAPTPGHPSRAHNTHITLIDFPERQVLCSGILPSAELS